MLAVLLLGVTMLTLVFGPSALGAFGGLALGS